MEELVVISGGTSGLGYEMAKCFAKKYSVCLLGRNKTHLDKALKNIPNTIGFAGDVADEKFVKDVCCKIQNYKVSMLINNAGVGRFGKPEETNSEMIKEVLCGNLIGTMLLTSNILPLLQAGGKIINIMSSAALKGNAGESVYCAAKWGVRGYTESLKAAYKGTNVKIMGVYPGGMDSPFWDKNRDYVPKEKSDKFLKTSEVAKIIVDNALNDKVFIADLTIERI